MPTKRSRALKWVELGKAKWVKTDLRIKAVRLLTEPSGRNTQPIVVGVDPGKLYSGIAVQSAKATLFQSHLELPYPTVTRHGFRKGDIVIAEMAGRVSVGYVSGDTAKQVSVSDFNWKRIGQFTASKVQLFYRATGILVSCPERVLVAGHRTLPTNTPIPPPPAARGGAIKGVF